MRPRLLRRSRLAGDGVAGNGGELGRPLVRDDAPQHRAQLGVDAGREDPPSLRLRRRRADDVVDEVGLDPLAAVRDGRVDGGELDRRDRDALPDRDGADRGARPVGGQQAGALAGEVDPGAAAETEARHPLLQAALAEVALRDLVRADVRRALEDLLDLQRLGPVRLRVVDHAVCDLQGAGNPDRRVRRDVVLRERAADRHDLEHRAGLEDVVHRVVDRQAVRGRRRVVVRVVARLLRHAEDRARVRVDDDRRRVLRVPLAAPCSRAPARRSPGCGCRA